MNQSLAHIALLVNDYDEAIHYYTQTLYFTLVEDKVMSATKRWVIIAPPGSTGTSILLAKASNEEQQNRVGNQTGGKVFLFLYTDDIERDYKNLKDKNVKIVEDLTTKPHGKVLVFADLYGNLWDLIEPNPDLIS
ncbi:MAG TPA: VOC family protein [Bacteroidia bacterium]|nr:VOC family protein [Bacteroidia bacterium]